MTAIDHKRSATSNAIQTSMPKRKRSSIGRIPKKTRQRGEIGAIHKTSSIIMAAQKEQGSRKDVDEDDDVILITEEEKPTSKNSDVAHSTESENLKVCKEMKEQIKAAQKEIQMTENEIKIMSQELKSMESDIGEAVYERLKFLVENPDCTVLLEDVDEDSIIEMISEELKEMGMAEDFSRSRSRVINEKLSNLEKANQSVSKMLLQCHTKLKSYGHALSEESAIVAEEIAMYEKILSSSTIDIDDDEEDVDNNSEDDVKIVDDPLPQNRSSSVERPSASTQSLNSGLLASRLQQPSPSQEDQKYSRPSTSKGFDTEIPSIDLLRSQFASVVNSQMPSLLTSLNAQQDSVQTSTPHVPLNPTEQTFWPALWVGDNIFGKKHNDVWYPGTITEVSSPNDTEWKCRVKFEGKGLKYLPGKHVAYKNSIQSVVRVGTRVVALYKEEDTPSTLFAGVIAEAPSVKNNKRFLVFFDDGYAQYCHSSEIHKVYMQSEHVWQDIHPDTSSFIKEYLDIYPERPMVRLAKGQVVRTEWNGRWWTAKVIEIDASLVKMVFQSDRRTEWIYRGSTRLEPLFRALANANAIKAAGTSKGRRHNLSMKPSNAHLKPSVEYTRGGVEDDRAPSTSTTKPKSAGISVPKVSQTAKVTEPPKKRANLAKKSTGGKPEASDSMAKSAAQWQAPWIRYQRKITPEQKKQQMPPQQDQHPNQGLEQFDPMAKNISSLSNAPNKRPTHSDFASLLQEKLAKNQNQMEYDEERTMGKRTDVHIDTKGRPRSSFVPHFCNPACIRDIDDDPLKFRGQSPLLIPLQCLWERHICKARPIAKRFVLYRTPCGRRIRCIEEVDKYLMLTNSQLTIDLFTFDHHLHVCTEFVPVKTFCDIKDLSYGKENYPVSCVNGIDRQYPDYLEYSHYRIPTQNVHLNLDPEFLACCDCTDNCRDKSKCACQRLTIENTSCIGQVDPLAGYHYRRLPEPLFTGIYECNSRCACDRRCHNRVAQLGLRTRLQVFKTGKKGWGLRCLNDIAKGSFICIYAGQLLTDKSANEDGKQYGDEYLAELDYIEVVEGQKDGYESSVEFSDDQDDKNYSVSKESDDSDFSIGGPLEGLGERRRSSRRSKSKNSNQEKTSTKKTEKTEEKEKPNPTTASAPINISDEDSDADDETDGVGAASAEKMQTSPENTQTSDNKQTSPENTQTSDNKQTSPENTQTSDNKQTSPENTQTTDNMQTSPEKTQTSPENAEKGEVRRRAKKSTGGSRLNLSMSLKTQDTASEKDESKKEKKLERIPTRSFFQDKTECYIMDAKTMGNLGRYLNHSCCPNVFVQNIFVDTHDLRFPWVSFFAGQHIRAGTELTWDYNYEVGSVPNKVLYCYCGSALCRGRLL